jgi:phosphoserine phosphatase RsbU/P
MVKGILNSITQKLESPERLFAELNTIFSRIAPRDMFVTMLFLVFDMKGEVLRYSNAGHNPVLFYDNAAKTCEMVELRGPALGLSKLAKFQEKQIALHAGDLLLIYTDGVTETFNQAGEMFGETNLLQAVQEMAAEPAEKIIAYIKDKLLTFRGKTAQSDDVAMIAVKMV